MDIELSLLVDSGGAEYPEDFFVYRCGCGFESQTSQTAEKIARSKRFTTKLKEGDWFFCGDAYSVVYTDKPRLIRGATTGQHLARIVAQSLSERDDDPLEGLELAIEKINAFNGRNSIPPLSSKRPGASFILGCAKGGHIRFLQAGDAQCFIKLRDGRLTGFKNQVLDHDGELLNIQDELAAKADAAGLTGNERKVMIWKGLAPMSEYLQAIHANKPGGYAILDGTDMATMLKYCAKADVAAVDLDFAVIASDGLVSWDETADTGLLALRVAEDFSERGLKRVLGHTRSIGGKTFGKEPEAIAIAIKRLP